MIKYYLTPNLLTEDDPNDYRAAIQSAESFDREAIIARMLQRGTLATKTDIVAILNLFDETVTDIIHEGGLINMPLMHTLFSMQGKFNGPLDVYDPQRHKLTINVNEGALLRKLEGELHVEKVAAPIVGPNIIEVHDIASDTINTKLTPGGALKVFGHLIKVVGENPVFGCGLWFVPATGDPVKTDTFVDNKPSTLTVIIPALAAGDYQLRVVTQFSGSGRPLATPKTATFDKILTVE
jgi:hypothetical protein